MAMSSLRLETEHCQVQGSTTPWEGLGEDKNKNMNPQTKGKNTRVREPCTMQPLPKLRCHKLPWALLSIGDSSLVVRPMEDLSSKILESSW